MSFKNVTRKMYEENVTRKSFTREMQTFYSHHKNILNKIYFLSLSTKISLSLSFKHSCLYHKKNTIFPRAQQSSYFFQEFLD